MAEALACQISSGYARTHSTSSLNTQTLIDIVVFREWIFCICLPCCLGAFADSTAAGMTDYGIFPPEFVFGYDLQSLLLVVECFRLSLCAMHFAAAFVGESMVTRSQNWNCINCGVVAAAAAAAGSAAAAAASSGASAASAAAAGAAAAAASAAGASSAGAHCDLNFCRHGLR